MSENRGNPRRRRTMRQENAPSGKRIPFGEGKHVKKAAQTPEEETVIVDDSFRDRHPVWTTLIAILVVALALALAWYLSTMQNPFVQPTLSTPKTWVVTTETPTLVPTEVPTLAPTEVPTEAPTAVPTEVPTEEPTLAPTEAPTETPTVEPTMEPTEVPRVVSTEAPHGEFIFSDETVLFKVDGQSYELRRFTYRGGYILEEDPWLSEEEKETEESYGPPIPGTNYMEYTQNWLMRLVRSGHQVIRLQTQMGMISPKSLEEENQLALKLNSSEPEEYDRVVNETLAYFFDRLNGGCIKDSRDWALENYMRPVSEDDPTSELHGRINGDDDTILEEKDLLLTYYDRTGKNFVSERQGFLNTLRDAKANEEDYSQLAWVNMDEGGTWKWKFGSKPDVTPTPTPSPTPTPTPSPTPTPTPSPTPTPTPTPTPRPTKDPGQRPTESDAPVGGGETNPENSTDPHTRTHTESTPAPENTATPTPTPTPTAVPTAVVRPSEDCGESVPKPIREDTNPQPEGDPNHNVAETETQGIADDSFDPDSI